MDPPFSAIFILGLDVSGACKAWEFLPVPLAPSDVPAFGVAGVMSWLDREPMLSPAEGSPIALSGRLLAGRAFFSGVLVIRVGVVEFWSLSVLVGCSGVGDSVRLRLECPLAVMGVPSAAEPLGL